MAEPSTRPPRLQRLRAHGWRLPAGAVYVGRPSKWGNPFPWRGDWIIWAAVAAGFRADAAGRRAAVVAFYREWLTGTRAAGPHACEDGGDRIVYESGLELSTAAAARGMAATFARLNSAAVSVPKPPPLADLSELRGRPLLCWCPLGQPCHADVLLELANA